MVERDIVTTTEEFTPAEYIDLDAYVPLEPEIDFIGSQSHLTRREKEFHMSESAGRLVDEHVLKLPFSRTVGRLRDTGHLEYVGVDMTASMQRVAQESGVGSRNWLECKGYEAVAQELSSGANATILFSPPKEGVSHSFTFVTLKGALAGPRATENSLIQLNIRHNGELHDPKEIQKRYVGLERYLHVADPKGFSLQGPEDFLQSPIAAVIETQEQVSGVLERLGISSADIEKSLFRQRQMEECLESMITLFAQSSIEATESADPELKEKGIDKARIVRRALYNKAEELWGDRTVVGVTQNRSLEEDVRYYAKLTARVSLEDADCPGANLASSDIAFLLSMGKTPSEIFGGIRIVMCKECPSCKRGNVKAVIYGGRIHCPHCKSSATYAC